MPFSPLVLQLRLASLIKSTESLRDMAHQLKLMLYLSDQRGLVERRNAEMERVRREIDVKRKEVAKGIVQLVGGGGQDDEPSQLDLDMEDEDDVAPESPVHDTAEMDLQGDTKERLETDGVDAIDGQDRADGSNVQTERSGDGITVGEAEAGRAEDEGLRDTSRMTTEARELVEDEDQHTPGSAHTPGMTTSGTPRPLTSLPLLGEGSRDSRVSALAGHGRLDPGEREDTEPVEPVEPVEL